MANISGKNLKSIDKLHEYSEVELLKIPIHSVLRLDATRKYYINLRKNSEIFVCEQKF